MRPETTLKWLFLDLNSFFASVAQQESPALRGRPVAVVPVANTDSTCAIAASREARAYGVKTGMPIYEARRICPALICVPAHHHVYVDYHHRILDEVIRHVPINKVWSIDELSSCLPPRLRNVEAATHAALRLKEGLRKNVGSCITASIGIAPNSFLAKVATDIQKPDGLVILEPQSLPGRLLDLDLTDLPGINVNMKKRLEKAGIHSMEHLWHAAPKQARRAWGSVMGERFWYNLHGYDIPDTPTKSSTIGHSRVLDPALRRPDAARLVARRLVIKAASRLRRREFHAAAFYLSIRDRDDRRWAAETRVIPAQDNFTFLRALDDLWRGMMTDMNPNALKKVSVGFYDLRRATEITPDLFTKPPARANALSGLMDSINEKYGSDAIRLGISPRTESGFVGTKIAFSRIPDREEFHE